MRCARAWRASRVETVSKTGRKIDWQEAYNRARAPDVYDTVQLFALNYEISVSEYLRSLILSDIESKFDMDEQLKQGLLKGFRESRGYEVAHEKGKWLSVDWSGNDVKDREVC